MRRSRRLAVPLLLAMCVPAPADERALEELLRLGGEYVVDYEKQFAVIVAEEEYTQRLFERRGGPERLSRILRSDILMVRVPGDVPWLCFRDVYKVGSKSVRDREARLQKLFLEAPESAVERARAILAEGARYNIGSTRRNFNVPTLPLVFLHPDNRHRFEFVSAGSKKIAGKRCRAVDYEEVGRPTLVRQGPNGNDLPARGRLFIHDDDGAVLRSELAFDITPRPGASTLVEGLVMVRVNYHWVEDLRLWLPKEMNESYETRTKRDETRRLPGAPTAVQATEYVSCKAKYKNYRRFGVVTDERYVMPR
jgi:hypothetical protein